MLGTEPVPNWPLGHFDPIGWISRITVGVFRNRDLE